MYMVNEFLCHEFQASLVRAGIVKDIGGGVRGKTLAGKQAQE